MRSYLVSHDSTGNDVYFQETTGRYSKFSETDAARAVQRAYRRRLSNVCHRRLAPRFVAWVCERMLV